MTTTGIVLVLVTFALTHTLFSHTCSHSRTLALALAILALLALLALAHSYNRYLFDVLTDVYSKY